MLSPFYTHLYVPIPSSHHIPPLIFRLRPPYRAADPPPPPSHRQEKPESRHAQKKLAESVTVLVHGEEGLRSAKRVTNAIYSRDPEALVSLGDAELRSMFRHSPLAELMMESGMTTLDLAMAAKCFRTEGGQSLGFWFFWAQALKFFLGLLIPKHHHHPRHQLGNNRMPS